MKHSLWALLAALVVGSCASTPPDRQVVLDAAEALGGRQKMIGGPQAPSGILWI